MRELDVDIATIYPIQATPLISEFVGGYKDRLANDEAVVDPAHLVQIPWAPEAYHILLDGHHKTRAAFDLGRTAIRSRLHENDNDLLEHLGGLMHEWRLRTLDKVVNTYANKWIVDIVQHDIVGIEDIPIDRDGWRPWHNPRDWYSWRRF